MPEGDTLHRTAVTLQRWLGGREVTEARAPRGDLAARRLVGMTVDAVEARGKHLLVHLARGEERLVVHSHLKMTGSWHVYPTGAAWQRAAHRARLVLTCTDRVAVCFDAPVLTLLDESAAARRTGPDVLGPDVLVDPYDEDEVVRRAMALGVDRPIGDVLLDQRVTAGIGNVYRCEVLFLEGLHPAIPLGALEESALRSAIRRAVGLVRANVADPGRRDLGLGPGRPWVHRRAGRPCRRCATAVRSRPQGPQARIAYWCPTCQPGLS